jgi:phage terminase large subunit GpA-like protein
LSLDDRLAVEQAGTIGEWASGLPVILDGKPFTFDRHEYLTEPYNEHHPDVTHIKATQLGLSTLAMLAAVYGARYSGFKGILYLFPSRADVLDFSRGRVNPLINDNPDSIGKWIQDPDSAGLKKVWNAFLYFRGMRSAIGLKSIPIDFLILDELDEAPQNSIDMAMARMSHSEFGEVLRLSNPTLPDYGVDLAFQATDQRYWFIKCPGCGHHNNLDETFPECLVELKDKVIRACIKCQAELNPSIGEWVAKHPSVKDKRGYHYSQLFSHYVDPGEILHMYRTTKNLQDFYNLKLGRPYVEAHNRLSVQEVLMLCGEDSILTEDPGPCTMGVDQGKDLHVVIGKKHAEKGGQIVHIGTYLHWEELEADAKFQRLPLRG